MNIKDRLDTYPVVATGARWPHSREGMGYEGPWGKLLERYPFLEADPRYAEFGSCKDEPDNPRPGSPGGGLFPVLCKFPDGTLACAVRTGATHKNTAGAQISLTISEDRGRTWSPYRVVVQGVGRQDARNQSLGVLGDGTLVLVYGMYDMDARARWIEAIRSCDRGRTWSAPRRVELGEEGSYPEMLHPHGQVLEVSPGTVVFNVRGPYASERYQRKPQLPERESYLCWSHDGGGTFSEITYVGPKTETSFLPLDGGDWICYSRMPSGHPQIGHSLDHGRSWTDWSDGYPNCRLDDHFLCYVAPGTILKLPSGRILVVHTYRNHPFGIRAVISEDGGRAFDWDQQYVLTDSYWTDDSGYPSTVCYEDGTIVTVAYTMSDMDHPDWGTCAIAYVYHESIFE